MKKNQFVGKMLSREDQKTIKGGMMAADCSHELCCTTPGGFECWNRSGISGGASAVCQGIYPAYGGAVSGNWYSVCVGVY
jgi:hypothetical protein